MFDSQNLTLIGLYSLHQGWYWSGGIVLVVAYAFAVIEMRAR
jgi:hypothetical protein